jgi:ubiquinone/menaquinone biosynthesis C-methylase UbiE/rhodanese-related sulfurtransferase
VLASVAAAALAQSGTEAFLQTSSRAAQEAKREAQQRLPDIFGAMGLRPGAVVADVGAGPGFFTVRLSKAVGDAGRVIAVDISAQALRNLRSRIDEEGLRNVEVVEGAADDPHLPERTLDAALIVNAYHEMSQHQAMLTQIRKALKPDGRLVIVEPISPSRRDGTREAQIGQHEIAPEFVLADARAAGFSIVTLQDPFSNHHGHGGEYLVALTPAAAISNAPQPAHDDPAEAGSSSTDLRMPAAEFATLVRSGDVIVLDVRDQASFERGHLPGARLAPMSALRDMLPELSKATAQIVTYCSCPAEETSSRAVLYLRKNGVQNVRALTGGYEAWAAAGNRVERGR